MRNCHARLCKQAPAPRQRFAPRPPVGLCSLVRLSRRLPRRARAQGKLSEAVKADDCLWNLSDGVVELTLTKAEGMHWWRSVMEGDPAIDTQQVEPENSKLEELDPETRTTVEKMMVTFWGGCRAAPGEGFG